MRIPLAAVLLLASVVSNLGAPLSPIPENLHRESTKEILNLEQELKKAAGEDKKPRVEPEIPAGPNPQDEVPAGLANEELVKELAAHEEASQDEAGPEQQKMKDEDDSAEEELQQEKHVAEKAAELKAEQEVKSEKEDKEELKEKEKESAESAEILPETHEEEEVVDKPKEMEPLKPEAEEEELQNLPVPNNMKDLYEDYINEQRQAYYDAKRSYGDALDNLAEQEGSKDMFVASLLETIREHPELLDEMRTEEEEVPRPGYNYNAAKNDREEALRAEYLAATRGLDQPAQYRSNELNQYQGRPYETANEIRPQVENYQIYPSDKMAKVVAKKWGYAAPEEEYFARANENDKAELAAAPAAISGMDKKDHESALEQPQHMEPIM